MPDQTDPEGSWYVQSGKQRYGPYRSAVLAEWIESGRIDTQSRVSNGGRWLSTEEFRQLHRLRAKATGLDDAETISDDDLIPDGDEPSNYPLESAPQSRSGASATSPTVPTPTPVVEDTAPPHRDRIVVIGRRKSGKTIFLASVYARLWRSLNGLTAKALSGDVHRELILTHDILAKGSWPEATADRVTRMDLELEHAGKKRLMVSIDYSGELFRKAFVEERSDMPGVKELTTHIDHAAAVILLVDPSVVASDDVDAAMDDDFGIVQAVQRLRNWPGGDAVPIVLVLTKMDQYQALLDRFGSSKEFVRHHFPALVRLMKQIPIFQVSAVQTEVGPDGKVRPKPDSQPVNIDAPLRYCLRAIETAEEQAEQEDAEQQHRMMELRLEREELEKDRKAKRLVIVIITVSVLVGAAAVAAILLLKV